MELKKCPKCGTEYPATTEYFHIDKTRKDGLTCYCKECRKIEKKNYRNKHKEKIQIQTKQYYEKNKEILSDKAKKYYIANKETIIKRNMKYRFMHPEYWEKQKEYEKRNKEKTKIRVQKWYMNNKEYVNNRQKEYYKENKDLYKKLHHKNYIENKGKYYVRREKRRTLTLQNIATLTIDEWEECLKFFDYKDAYTGLPMNKVSQDHVIPLSKGGGYTKQNIVPCENSINISKHNNDMEMWYKKQPFYSEERLNKIYKWINIKDNRQQLKFI